jgi:prepilin peptidase CpaA
LEWGNAAAAVVLVIAFISDIRTHKIPNWLTVPACAAALVFHSLLRGLQGMSFSLAGLAFGLAALLFIHLLKGIGAGDVKLFAALGAWVGLQAVWSVLMYSIVYAGAAGLVMLLILRRPIKGMRFPFMIAVIPGAVTCWVTVYGWA